MAMEITRTGDTLTARLAGEIDHHTAADLRQRLDAAIIGVHPRRLVLDFSGITFMDSSGVGLIMGRYRLLQGSGGALTLQGVGERPGQMLRLAGLDKLPIWPESDNQIERNDRR